jgi:hypothetical protein
MDPGKVEGCCVQGGDACECMIPFDLEECQILMLITSSLELQEQN